MEEEINGFEAKIQARIVGSIYRSGLPLTAVDNFDFDVLLGIVFKFFLVVLLIAASATSSLVLLSEV